MQTFRTTYRSKYNPTFRKTAAWIALAIVGANLLAGCGRSDAQQQNADRPTIREARPTFTPTAVLAAQAAAPLEAPAEVLETSPAETGDQSAVPTGAIAVINFELVNVRTGPSTDYEVVTIVERGQEFDIIAKNGAGDWWQVCCIEDKTAWVIGEYVDTIGTVDQVPTAGPEGLTVSRPPASPTATPIPTIPATPTTAVVQPTQAPPPTATAEANVGIPADPVEQPFQLADQEQFPESQLVRIFLYVTDGSQGLAGYALRVTKDGVELPANGTTFGGPPGFTWPFQDVRQRSQNLKLEFPGTAAAGVWEIQLIDGAGTAVGPVAQFTLEANDGNRELYVLYQRN